MSLFDQKARNALAAFLQSEKDTQPPPFVADYASSAPSGLFGIDRPYTNAKNLHGMTQHGQPQMQPDQIIALENELNKFGLQLDPRLFGNNSQIRSERMIPKNPLTYPDDQQSMSLERSVSPMRPTPQPWSKR